MRLQSLSFSASGACLSILNSGLARLRKQLDYVNKVLPGPFFWEALAADSDTTRRLGGSKIRYICDLRARICPFSTSICKQAENAEFQTVVADQRATQDSLHW